MSGPNKEQMNGIYGFMERAYQGNWVRRWGGETPYMIKANQEGKTESILAHQWSMMALWYQLRRVAPELNKAVDSTKLYEMIINHDLGEIREGDISMFQQIQGQGANKVDIERQEISQMIVGLSKSTQAEILASFDMFEAKIETVNDIETLVAKYLDAFQGDHFAMTFGNDLPTYSEIISKIVNKRFLAYSNRLATVLTSAGKSEAAEEVKTISDYHVEHIRSIGIVLD